MECPRAPCARAHGWRTRRVLVVAVGRSLPGVASLGVITVLILYLYGMVGWLIFDEHNPEEYGTIGRAMLSLFVPSCCSTS